MIRDRFTPTFLLAVALVLPFAFLRTAAAAIDCDEFTFEEDAQAILDALPLDPFRLDESNLQDWDRDPPDGVPCDEEPGGNSRLRTTLRPMRDADAPPPVFDEFPTAELPADVTEVQLPGTGHSEMFRVKEIKDFAFDEEYYVELIGIAMPQERERANTIGVECFGDEAAEYLESELRDGRTIWLEADVADQDEDPVLDAVLRYVWVESARGGYEMLNELFVREGYAVVTITPPNTKYAGDLRRAQEEAIQDGAGLWGACADYDIRG